MNFADAQRAELARLLDRVGPDAPTLCGDWSTYDLVAHLWVRENDPIALPGIGLSALAKVTAARMSRAKQRFSYAELIRRFNRPRVWTKAMRIANGIEFLVHRLDVLRADQTLEYSPPSRAEEDAVWPAVKLLSLRLRRAKVGVVLERADTKAEHRATPGSDIVTLSAKPSELLLLLTGRGRFAKIEYIGDGEPVAKIRGMSLEL